MKKSQQPAFEKALLRKLDHASISILGRDFVQITNTFTNKYLYLDHDTKNHANAIRSTTTPTCVTIEDYVKLVKALPAFFLKNPDQYSDDIVDQFQFEGVDGNSTTDFIDPTGWHTLS